MIPYGRQDIHQEDVDAVVAVLRSDYLTQGPMVPQFEATVAKVVGAAHAVAANSATSALHIACLALGLGRGDWLWTSPITFVASSNAALYCGANVDFVDIDPKTYNMSATALEQKLIEAQKKGSLPKIVMPVHLCGQSCDMAEIARLAKIFGFKVIEDASHAIGGKYNNQYVGGCRYSDITVFSFHPVKIITTAEGGMALTNDPQIASKMELFRSHGITRDERLFSEKNRGAWHYEQITLGYNYRMTDVQAAIGISQMDRLEQYVTRRHQIASIYNLAFSDLPVTTPFQIVSSYSAYHLYIVRIPQSSGSPSRDELFAKLRSDGVGVNVHYIPVHTQPYYKALGFNQGDFPAAERFYEEAISLPLFPGMDKAQQDKVIEVLKASLCR